MQLGINTNLGFAAMVIQCELCTADVLTADELHTHFSSHFSSGRCGNCHKQLIVVDGLIYTLQLHNHFDCNQSSFDDADKHGGFGDIKTEIDELACGLFPNDRLEISSQATERKPNNDSDEVSNDNDDILPFEMVECDVIKCETELVNTLDGPSVLENFKLKLPTAIVKQRIAAKKLTKKLTKKSTKKLPFRTIGDDSEFQCNICEKYFRGRSELVKHKRWHYRVIHKDDIRSAKVPIDENDIESMSSGQVVIKPSGERVVRQFLCKYCQKYLMSEHSLREHIKRIHLFRCEEKTLTEEQCRQIPSEQIHTKPNGEKCRREFKCTICSKYFLHRDTLKKHHDLHSQQIGIKDEKGIPPSQLSVKPSGEMFLRKFNCTVCDKYFLTNGTLSSHMRVHQRPTIKPDSSSTGVSIIDFESIPADRIYVQPSGERQLREKQCEACGRYFLSEHSLREHFKRAHLPENQRPLLTEEECKQLPVEQIMTRVTGEKILREFQCSICNKYLMTEQILNGHLKLHKERANQNLTREETRKLPSDRLFVKPTGEVYLRKYKCSLCEKYFLTRGVLASHMKTHERRTFNSDAAVKDATDEALPADRIYVNATGEKQLREVQCQICGKYLLSKHTLGEHIKNVHQSVRKNMEKPQMLTEDEFKNLSPQQVLVTSAGEKYLKKYQCDICSKYILTKQSVLYHMKSSHYPKTIEENAAGHVCDICGKVLKKKWSLKVHKETHSDSKKFICNYCGQSFRTKNHMEEHTNTHTGLKPFKCMVCSKTFGKRSLLNAHRRIHTGEKPYKCNQEGCERAYAYSSDLNRHLYGAHGIYTKKFECQLCSRIFPENKLLTKHMKSHV